ncbi:hypothetical protein [Pedobacter psychrodurus]|uniref:hypothetical protein n=1 Tax=Pedobacter psychrodurus TaxID=2530456 RepID=UPI0029301F55|nr:hypothetical protein [Pedobacter psychrodurus]
MALYFLYGYDECTPFIKIVINMFDPDAFINYYTFQIQVMVSTLEAVKPMVARFSTSER